MAWIGTYVYSTFFGGATGDEGYKPSIQDVLDIKGALHIKLALPYELVDSIVDLAEYWPHTSTVTTQPTIVPTRRNRAQEEFVLRSLPIGYVPPIINATHAESDLAIRDIAKYHSLQPKPIPDQTFYPQGATEEVLSRWSHKSLTKGEHPCRKIVFTIRSHDQGWGGQAGQRGTYEGSFTWFEAGLERMTAYRQSELDLPEVTVPNNGEEIDANTSTASGSLDPSELPRFELNGGLHPLSEPWAGHCNLKTIIPSLKPEKFANTLNTFHHVLLPSPTLTIQRNAVATKETRIHKVTLLCYDNVVPDSPEAVELGKQGRGPESANGEFVRNLKVGDVVTVWAMARFPGWVNYVEEVKIDVYWAV